MSSSAQRLVRMGFGFASAQALSVVADLGIADLLHEGPRNVDDLAHDTKTDPEGDVRRKRVGLQNLVIGRSQAAS